MKRILLVFVVGILLIIAVGFAYYSHVGVGTTISKNAEDWGQFGDYFGGIAGALLSFLSILLLVYTLVQQSEQIAAAEHEMLKRDLLAHITKADDEIEHWLQRKLAALNTEGTFIEFGDVVWELINPNLVNPKEFESAIIRLHKLTCLYCEALALYRANIDSYFIFKYHQQKAQSLLNFLRKHQRNLDYMAGPSLDFCQMHLDGKHET